MHIYLCEVCHIALLGDLSAALFKMSHQHIQELKTSFHGNAW